MATLLGLGMNQGAYTAEVVRGGILSVDVGQTEAAKAIGMTRLTTLRRIVLPQAMRVIIPPVGNEFISMVKLTSLASVIQYSEILRNAQTIYYANARVIELLIVAGRLVPARGHAAADRPVLPRARLLARVAANAAAPAQEAKPHEPGASRSSSPPMSASTSARCRR